jgi:ribosomal protein S16
MERVSLRQLASSGRLIREAVVVTYADPRNGREVEIGIFTPIARERDVGLDSEEIVSGVLTLMGDTTAEDVEKVRRIWQEESSARD